MWYKPQYLSTSLLVNVLSLASLQLLAPGEVTPGITAAEYAQRRAVLAKLMPPNSFAVVASAAAQYMVGLIPYPYRQDADFRYLTGVVQKSVIAVFESSCRGISQRRDTKLNPPV